MDTTKTRRGRPPKPIRIVNQTKWSVAGLIACETERGQNGPRSQMSRVTWSGVFGLVRFTVRKSGNWTS